MTQAEALYRFFNRFTIPAYPATAVPDNVAFPYMTYEAPLGVPFDTAEITAQLWYHTESEAEPNAKAEEIREIVKDGGVAVPYDGGFIWVSTSSPFCKPVNTQDNTIKCRAINLHLEFI